MLLDPDAVFQFYGPEAPRIRFTPGGIVQQGREYRIAVDAGDAGPYHPPGPVDQRRSLAIADGPQVERALIPAGKVVFLRLYRSVPLVRARRGRRTIGTVGASDPLTQLMPDGGTLFQRACGEQTERTAVRDRRFRHVTI